MQKSLFWDTDFDKIYWGRYQKAVIYRILERGTEADKQEIARFYSIPYKPRGENEYKEVVLDQNTMEYIEDAFYSLLEEYQINFDKLTY